MSHAALLEVADRRRVPERGRVDVDRLRHQLREASAAAPASAEAAVFRALATLPDVTVHRGVTDAAGDATIALSGDGGVFDLLLDPTTYAPLGLRVVSSGSEPLLPMAADKS